MLKPALLALAVAALAGPAVAADADVTGVWLSPTRSAHVELTHCGEAICGRILTATKPKSNPNFLDVHNKSQAQRDRKIIGLTILEGFRGGPTHWSGGRVYNPGDGNTYRASLTLVDNDHLIVKGCALMVLCKSQAWTRVQE